jgi:broad specificity phosphatase PhoE
MAGTSRVWLVRHGETTGQSSIRYHGRNDVPLSDAGRDQIRALAPLLKGLKPALLVHSPLSRAAESAQILMQEAQIRPVRLQSDERLREISFGDCEGMTVEEIAAAHPEFWARHQRGEEDAFPGGESRTAFRARIAATVSGWSEAHPGEDVVIVAHRGIVRTGLRTLLGMPVDPDDPFGVRLGSLSVVRREAAGPWRLEVCDLVP